MKKTQKVEFLFPGCRRCENVVETQKQVHKFYGFKTPDNLYWNWQYTQDENDETAKSYKESFDKFEEDFNL